MNSRSDPSFLAVHEEALTEVDEAYHSFLLLYRSCSKCVYGFCEGKDDPTFYQTLIIIRLPNDWTVKVIPAGGKKKVFRAYHSFDWNRFSKEEICFFVDRDLDDYLGQPAQHEANIYTTDGYSIENSIYDCRLLLDVLSDIYQITLLSSIEEEEIFNVILSNLEVFATAMIPLMAQILLWRRSGARANLSNLNLDNLFKFRDNEIIPNPRDALLSTASKQIGTALNTPEELMAAEKEIANCSDLRMLIRGKFIAWFMVKQCEGLWVNITVILKRFTSKPKKRVEFGHKNANVIFAPRARIPESLCGFLDSTYCRFIRSREGSRPVPG